MATKEKLVTYDDYRNLPDDGKRYEIIKGELFMTPAPSTDHQKVSRNIFLKIHHYVSEKNLGDALYAPVDVVLSMTDVVQPDLVFISKEREKIITKKNIVEAPDLIIEIISEHTEAIDRNRKKALYERYHVREYWIVHPDERQVEQYVLEEGAFKHQTSAGASGKLTSKAISGFRFQLKDMFES